MIKPFEMKNTPMIFCRFLNIRDYHVILPPTILSPPPFIFDYCFGNVDYVWEKISSIQFVKRDSEWKIRYGYDVYENWTSLSIGLFIDTHFRASQSLNIKPGEVKVINFEWVYDFSIRCGIKHLDILNSL